MKEFHYRWQFQLQASPEALWPLVSDTDRFNRDVGLPALERPQHSSSSTKTHGNRLRLRKFGIGIEWEEEPFEWVRPFKFGVKRNYIGGPIGEMRVLAELVPRAGGGTDLFYDVWAVPRNVFGQALIPLQIGKLSARTFGKTLRAYDRKASAGKPPPFQEVESELTAGAGDRLHLLGQRLEEQTGQAEIVRNLEKMIACADEMSLARIRPYELADYWMIGRRAVLETCLVATQIGMLDLQWDIICPHCRGAGQSNKTLSTLTSHSSCGACNIDFDVDFDRSVELTFRPNPSIRKIEVQRFCVGGPGVTPHIVSQQLLAPGEVRKLRIPLEAGRYRARTAVMPGARWLEVVPDGDSEVRLIANAEGWPKGECCVSSNPELTLENQLPGQQLFVLERTSWSDQATTAAQVTALQMFRDLFSSEALRPGERISVGSLTVLFTDLRGSTQLYRAIGDAPAFGRVMNHFDVLRALIADEEGALVKTIGDAVMAVFRRPANAVRASLRAQKQLASLESSSDPLYLKVGIHAGSCIAVTLNDRLDYFGGTINMAARLEGLSTGHDLVISKPVREDPEVEALLGSPAEGLVALPFQMNLKGFDEEQFDLWRVSEGYDATVLPR